MIMHQKEKGFVLATSLALLLLMTMLMTAVYFSVSASRQSSMAAESSTEAFYYAETATNYIAWALANDAEFDSYTYATAVDTVPAVIYSFPEPVNRLGSGIFPLPNASAVGDYSEWKSNMGNPSAEDIVPCAFDSCIVAGVRKEYSGQLQYLDNRPLADRSFSWPGAIPALKDIHQNLPRYIRLDIDIYGNISSAIPPYDNYAAPYHGSVVGVDIPENGAIVWLTIGDTQKDIALSPMDRDFAPFVDGTAVPTPVATSMAPFVEKSPLVDYLGAEVFSVPLGVYYQNFPCDITLYDYATHYACDEGTGTWLTSSDFALVAYAVGYVRGEPKKIIRIVLAL